MWSYKKSAEAAALTLALDMRSAVEMLTGEQWKVIILRYFVGLSVAALLGKLRYLKRIARGLHDEYPRETSCTHLRLRHGLRESTKGAPRLQEAPSRGDDFGLGCAIQASIPRSP